MRTITMLTVALMLCGSAWAEDCSQYYDIENKHNCRIANAVEEISNKMNDPRGTDENYPLLKNKQDGYYVERNNAPVYIQD